MTGNAAAQMGIRDRGFVREGQIADLVVFNPATIADTATYERPHQYPTGIDHVVVNGVPVLDPEGPDRLAPRASALRSGANAMRFVARPSLPSSLPLLRRSRRRAATALFAQAGAAG